MRSAAIVEVEIAAHRCARLADAVVGSQIDLLVFDAVPQPLDEYVVPPSPFSVHADRDAVVGEHAGEGRAPVNCEPWSVLKISGLPCFSKASCSVSTQKSPAMDLGGGREHGSEKSGARWRPVSEQVLPWRPRSPAAEIDPKPT